MGPAFELFLLFLLGLGIVIGAAMFFTMPLWKRAAKTLCDTDRQERQALEEKARERAEEAECRRRAEEELQRSLRGEDVPGSAAQRRQAVAREEPVTPCEDKQTVQIQTKGRQ